MSHFITSAMAACIVWSCTNSVFAQENQESSWLLFRSDAQRTSRVNAITKGMEKPWRRSVFFEANREDLELSKWPKGVIQEVTMRETRIPGFFPLAQGIAVYSRNYTDVSRTSLIRQDDLLFDPTRNPVLPAGGTYWRTFPLELSLCSLASNQKVRPVLESAIRHYCDKKHDHGLFTNGSIGTLSSDDRLIYAVDEWALPVPPSLVDKVEKRLNVRFDANYLVAFDVENGRAMWEIGSFFDRDKEWSHSLFLGAPLPLHKKLYVLNEKDQEIRLIRIDPHQRKDVRGKVERIVPLAKIDSVQAAKNDFRRRNNPVHLAYGGGLLICPTHAGEIYGVDESSLETRWKVKYCEPQKEPKLDAEWIGCAPMVHEGKILFTPPDAAFVFCFRLKDGQLLWKTPRTDDLFLASAHGDRALLIGKRAGRLLTLADGKEVAKFQTGSPAGLGFAHDQRYFLPLREPAGALDILDMQASKVERRWQTPEHELGNLIYHRGMVISQSALTIAAFPMIELK